MDTTPATRLLALGCAALLSTACATVEPRPPAETPPPPRAAEAPAPPPKREILPEAFESDDFIVAFARAGDTSESLALRFLGDRARAWMIEDYNDTATFEAGQEVVIPKRAWNLAGVGPSGYALVPVLVYHDIGREARGRLLIAARTFEEQMRFLKSNGYRVVSLREFYEFIALKRQMPRKAVVLTFDDGYKSFLQYAYPVLKELGFSATLFVYTDYVGAGRNALGWDELRKLAAEGFQIEGHTKTHSDLRRRPNEPEAEHLKRLRAEMEIPQKLFRERLGEPGQFLAYPYGATDDAVIERVRESGYAAGFTVLREGNPSFVPPFRARRSQIYSEMTLEDFAKNLNTFNEEAIR
ncbi:MAG: polysaccharide deacetylase family protein [Candidatus Rokubacteria bacterium]|nr:polysaccharide deacetylase family protein [Candidatus Rokubacteria bacterium]